jgi:hypothetical protein
MLSLQKILALLAIIALVWYGFKFVGRLDRARKQKLREDARRGPAPEPRQEARPPARDADVIDLVKSPDGQSYTVGRDDRA